MTLPSDSRLNGLPAPIQQQLTELCASLSAQIGAALSSVIVYGSVARNEYKPMESDVDLLIVLNDDSMEQLEAIGPMLRLARVSARIEAILLSASEIPRAADVFPLLYTDIKQEHIVLVGSNPFAELDISESHQRLRIEQELRDARIRLRRIIVESVNSPRQLLAPLSHKLKQIRSPLHILLQLKKTPAPSSHFKDVLEASCSHYQLAPEPLLQLNDPHSACATLVSLLDAAIHEVDQLHD
jgi:predicted nucleotidyltransferase